MTAQMTMRAEDPKLYQNLFAGKISTLPAYVAHRLHLGENTIAAVSYTHLTLPTKA